MRGNDDSGLNVRKIRDLITPGRYAVAESATEVFSCAYEACSACDVLVPNHENGTPTTGQKYVAEYDVDNDLYDLGPRLSRKTHYTLIKFSAQRKVAEANYLSFGTFASELSKSDTTGREPDDRVVVRGHDVSGQNTWKTCDLITLESSAVAVSATDVFSCASVACCAWDGSVTSYNIGALTTGQKYDAEYDGADDLTGAFSYDLRRGSTEYSDSDFESILVKPLRTRSNTTSDRDLDKIVFQNVTLPTACPACPRNLIISPDKRQIRSVQQSLGKIVGIEDNTEENDNMLEEIYATVYVKMINGKTISIRHHRNMTAAVISDEVERRSLIPRDMIRLVHKGKMISEKKTMKENNIEAKATIEMSLRLLGGMEVNEQMDTREAEEDREKKES